MIDSQNDLFCSSSKCKIIIEATLKMLYFHIFQNLIKIKKIKEDKIIPLRNIKIAIY